MFEVSRVCGSFDLLYILLIIESVNTLKKQTCCLHFPVFITQTAYLHESRRQNVHFPITSIFFHTVTCKYSLIFCAFSIMGMGFFVLAIKVTNFLNVSSEGMCSLISCFSHSLKPLACLWDAPLLPSVPHSSSRCCVYACVRGCLQCMGCGRSGRHGVCAP